ncbi:hypothetical protein HBI26_234910 [Parastagonospora nodorum]|nr:hypothetical protein HBI79_231430 [Parastagonospora nodorum]KAH5005282.1 hypothetical protein HBI74_225590 [Parastagonospora nodorum]KAH5135338.1 hypothetical protein HBH69_239290 [Parastagonospora nodorum]KAH5168948.1 hypothetical protein HBH77_232910 [Parastagonospora nodorum]KAH5554040.1 hypothetical protein HBI26_234910 [Parastagonospora nodorum]
MLRAREASCISRSLNPPLFRDDEQDSALWSKPCPLRIHGCYPRSVARMAIFRLLRTTIPSIRLTSLNDERSKSSRFDYLCFSCWTSVLHWLNGKRVRLREIDT